MRGPTRATLLDEVKRLEERLNRLEVENNVLKGVLRTEPDGSNNLWNPRTATYVSLDKLATAMAKVVETAIQLARR